MQPIEISPVLPAAISRLPELGGNLSFSWHRPTRALFEDLDPQLWQQTSGNPRLMLRCLAQDALDRAARDEAYLARYREAVAIFDSYLAQPSEGASEPLIAYFCAEYGFHESFPIYSGGLGILAGDHCKSASDERLNFIAVGLLYRQGYFTQNVDSRRRAARGVSRRRSARSAGRAGQRPQRPVAEGRGADREPRGAGARLACAGRPRDGLPARHQLPGQLGRRSRHHATGSTAATSACASARRWCSASAARVR